MYGAAAVQQRPGGRRGRWELRGGGGASAHRAGEGKGPRGRGRGPRAAARRLLGGPGGTVGRRRSRASPCPAGPVPSHAPRPARSRRAAARDGARTANSNGGGRRAAVTSDSERGARRESAARRGREGGEGKARGAGPHLSRMRGAVRRAEGRNGWVGAQLPRYSPYSPFLGAERVSVGGQTSASGSG